jgi:GntR family transcriptional regulator / MocR family aminotransferase
MEVHVSLPAAGGRGDLSARIYRQLRDAVLDGRLRPGERVPPTRELAARLDVSRNTVAAAYDRLTAEGLLVGRVGAGTYVCSEPLAPAGTARSAPGGGEIRPRPRWDGLEPRVTTARGTVAYDFDVGVPDVRLFPFPAWRRLVVHELTPAAQPPAGYGGPDGLPGLRAAIARYIGLSRSVRAGADDVVVTRGAQQALDLVGRVLLDPGDVVAVEEPGYPPARNLFRSLGARVVGVPVDGEGLVVDALPAAARLVYTTPSHQFPLGTPMSLARRAALLGWAERAGAAVIEDDYDSEYRFSDRPLEPLQSLDRGGRVVYVGSFSKTMLPMLRLGFLVAPASLLPALRVARQLSDWHGDLPAQAALARFLDEGLLSRHLRRASREYAGRHARILAALRGELARWLEPVPSAAGLHLCARLRPGVRVDMAAVVARARERDVFVSALGSFAGVPPDPDGLVIGYGAVRPERIEEGMRRLAATFRELAEPAQRL